MLGDPVAPGLPLVFPPEGRVDVIWPARTPRDSHRPARAPLPAFGAASHHVLAFPFAFLCFKFLIRSSEKFVLNNFPVEHPLSSVYGANYTLEQGQVR